MGCATSSFTPYLTSVTPTAQPLVAQYSITHYQAGFTAWVEFGTDTNYGRQTSVVTDTVGGSGSVQMNILVAGMLPNTAYHMRAHVEWNGSSWIDEDHIFTTGALPSSPPLPKITVSTSTSSSTQGPNPVSPGVELLSLVPNPSNPTAFQAVATDLQGNVIWYCPQSAIAPKLLPNGHFLFQLGNDLQEVDLACNVIRDVNIGRVNQSLQAQGYTMPPLVLFHHDAIVLPNGHWITIAQIKKDYSNLTSYPGTTTVIGDALVDIDPNGNVGWAWSSFDHLDVNRNLMAWPDWTHSNAVVYTPDGNLLLSMRHQSWILKIDYRNGSGGGDILWKLGYDGSFNIQSGDPSQWFYGQHYPYIVDVNGSVMTLAVYDDGNLRLDSTLTPCGSSATAPACYTRAAIFEVDESTNSATLLWDYLPGYFSVWGGSITTLPNNDVEFASSDPFGPPESLITEVTQKNPQIVWQMTIDGLNAYRGDRIPSLYPGVTWTK
jgi:arylsulfate sulfotransferase